MNESRSVQEVRDWCRRVPVDTLRRERAAVLAELIGSSGAVRDVIREQLAVVDEVLTERTGSVIIVFPRSPASRDGGSG